MEPYFYDADGRQDQVENALGQYTTTTFTPDGQTASVKDNLGNTVRYVYRHGQELLSTTDALNHTSSSQYDSRYRLIQTDQKTLIFFGRRGMMHMVYSFQAIKQTIGSLLRPGVPRHGGAGCALKR